MQELAGLPNAHSTRGAIELSGFLHFLPSSFNQTTPSVEHYPDAQIHVSFRQQKQA